MARDLIHDKKPRIESHEGSSFDEFLRRQGLLEEAYAHAMGRPPHPGGIVRRQCLEPLGLSVTKAAGGLGITRQALSDLVNGRAGISVDMAIRLAKAFGSSPETWLGLQMARDLRRARSRGKSMSVRRFAA